MEKCIINLNSNMNKDNCKAISEYFDVLLEK